MNYIYSFEKLDVWQLSRVLVKEIYSVTEKFPEKEKFGLVNQIRRAAVSVSSNLAEGSGRISRKDKAHFVQLAYGSLMEVLCQLIISSDLEYITDAHLSELRSRIQEISNKLNALRNSFLTK